MENEEIAGYLIRLELENGDDRFWNLTEEWVEDPGEAELFEQQEAAEAVVDKLSADASLTITIEEVIYDDEEDEDEDHDGEGEDD